ncbi:MAG: hypothetical protein GQ538_12575 [Xanthomonadales bacterium]|nr:hypothetical protein [Xanthomonadales bacterium]
MIILKINMLELARLVTGLEQGFSLGSCEIRPSEHCIINAGKEHHVEPKSMAVLLVLAESGEHTVSREELISSVWPRGYVTDDVLNRCISQLRISLGDNPKAPTFIATVPRKGYRLVTAVQLKQDSTVDGVLVLPFQNLVSEGRDEYLADGLTELLIARLAVAMDQRVISRTTAMAFKGSDPAIPDIRKQLGVQWVVEGSLLQLRGQLQIVVQLIDTQADAHAWAETWARPAEDIMSVLNEVTRQVSTQINAKLTGSKENPSEAEVLSGELMRRYLQGMHHASKRAATSLRQALVCFEDVLAEHAEHSPSLAGKAMCHLLLVHYGAESAVEGIAQARSCAGRALKIDPQNADAMSHLGAVCFFYEWDFEKAGKLAHAALEIKPNQEMALILAANVNLVNGNYEKSQVQVDKAITIDPLNVGVLMNAGDILILQRRYGEAIISLRQALELEPRFRPACFRLALAQALDGQHQESRDSLKRALDLGEEDAAYYEYQALVAGQLGEQDAAAESASTLAEISENGEPVLPWSMARAWAAAGEVDKAIASLEQAFAAHSSSMPFLGQTPMLNSIRKHAKVQELMKKTGLPVW